MTPEELLQLLQKTIDEGVVVQVYKAASVREAEILTALREQALDVYSLDDVRRLPTHVLDPVADAHLRASRRLGALAGATWGAGGVITAVPELMHLMVAVMRSAQRLSLTYGQEFDSYAGNLALWEAIGRAFGVDPHAFEGAENELLKNLPTLRGAQASWSPVILGVARQVLISLAFVFLRKRWSRLVPVVGIGISGYGNYALLKRVGRVLRDEFRQRHLMAGLSDTGASIPIRFEIPS